MGTEILDLVKSQSNGDSKGNDGGKGTEILNLVTSRNTGESTSNDGGRSTEVLNRVLPSSLRSRSRDSPPGFIGASERARSQSIAAPRNFLERYEKVSVSALFFTHDSISSTFKNGDHAGAPLSSLIDDLRSGLVTLDHPSLVLDVVVHVFPP